MGTSGGGQGPGTRIAVGVLLLWFGGALLFFAFLSGKVPSLQVGTDQAGNPQGALDISGALIRVAANTQALEGGTASAGTGAAGGAGATAGPWWSKLTGGA